MSTGALKEVAKVKKILHPNSRKTIAIAKKANKKSKRQKIKMSHMLKHHVTAEKLMWFQEHMVPDVCPYTPALTRELLLNYIGRNDEELKQIIIKRSLRERGRRHASREDIIKMTKAREQEEFDTCGIEIPDILIPTQCEMLRNWNGELNLLSNFKFRRFGRKHLRDVLPKLEK